MKRHFISLMLIVALLLPFSLALSETADDGLAENIIEDAQLNDGGEGLEELEEPIEQEEQNEIDVSSLGAEEKTNFPGGLSESDYAPNRIIITLTDTLQPQSRMFPDLGVAYSEIELLNPYGVTAGVDSADSQNSETRSATTPQNSVFVLTLDESGADALENALAILNANPLVDIAEPDYVLHPMRIPDDPFRNYQWALTALNAQSAWDITTGSKNVVVGIVDTGIDGTHPDLIPNLWVNPNQNQNGYVNDRNGYSFGDNIGGTPYDNGRGNSHGHGTHVAGIVGAKGNNGIGVTGINWDVSLAWLGIMDSNGDMFTSYAMQAIDYANFHKIPITNNSYGNYSSHQQFRDAIARYNGLFVAAAGNETNNNDTNPVYPASYNLPNVISVASFNQNGAISDFSNFGRNSVHVAAPGGSIYSTMPNNSYSYMGGTSMATPYVAGIAALMLTHRPSMTTTQLRNTLFTSSSHTNSITNQIVRWGCVDAYAALTGINSQSVLGGTVRISGTTRIGQQLTANVSGLVSNPQISLGTLSYQWLRNGTTNIGTGSAYRITEADIGASITVIVTAANCIGKVTSAAIFVTVTDYPQLEMFVRRLYQHTLLRIPSLSEVNYYIDNLLSGAPGTQVAYGFFFSPEFIGRNLSNSNYVNTLYSVFFDRTPASFERSYWVDMLAGGWPREDIFAGFANSNEFDVLCRGYGIVRGTYVPPAGGGARAFVTRLYDHTMSRTPAAFEVDYHVNNLLGGAPGVSVAYGFFFSPEFVGRNLNNTNYVNTLYRVFFDRTPASSERSYWVDRLVAGWPRENVFAGFANSNEFDVLCRGFGIVRGTYTPPPY